MEKLTGRNRLFLVEQGCTVFAFAYKYIEGERSLVADRRAHMDRNFTDRERAA